jgi:hypothetical protein
MHSTETLTCLISYFFVQPWAPESFVGHALCNGQEYHTKPEPKSKHIGE